MSFYNFGSGLNEIDLVYENTAENVELSNLSMRVSVVEEEISQIPDTTDLNNLFITVGSNTSNITILENRIDLDLINFDLRLNDDEAIINLNSSNIIIASNNNSSNLSKINDLIINDIALDVRLDVIETASTNYVTLNGSQTITNKIFSYNSNQFLDFPTSGGGGGGGDVTLNGMQTLTNKTIDYNNNQLQNLPEFDDSVIQTTLTDLDTRLNLAEDDITDTNNAVISNITNINSLSNALAVDIGNLSTLSGTVSTLSGTVSTHTGQITTNSTNLTTLSNALAVDIGKLSTLSNVVSTNVSQISTNTIDISNRVIAPATNTTNFIPQWNGTNSKTLKNGIDVSTLATLTGSQTITNKIFSYNSNQFLDFPTSGGDGTFAPSVSNVTVVNSNIPISVLNINNPYKFKVKMSANTTPVANTITIVALNVIDYDTNNNFSTGVSVYSVPVTGYYKMTASINLSVGYLRIYNGSGVLVSQSSMSSAAQSTVLTDTLFFTQNESVTLRSYNAATSTITAANSFWAGELIAASTPATIPIVTTTNINAYNYSGSGNIMTGQFNSNNYIPVWSSNNSTYLNNGVALTDLTAYNLASATTTVSISSATAPSSNQVLTAISASNAIWKTPTSTGSSGHTVMPTQTLNGSTTNYIFTGIPSTANQIIISLYAVFATNAGTIYFRIGTGSVLTSTNYSGLYTTFGASSSSTSAKDTTGYPIPNLVGGYVFYGALTLTPVNSNKSIWSISGNILNNTSSGVILCSGFGSLSGALDCVGLVMPTGGGGNFVSVIYI